MKSSEKKSINGYKLTKLFYSFCNHNTGTVKPHHHAIYNYFIHLCNKLGWVETFGIPTSDTMHVLGISSKRTYYNAINDLADWGLIVIIEISKNQHSSTKISLSNDIEIKSVAGALNVPARLSLKSTSRASAELQHSHQHNTHIKTLKLNKLKNCRNGVDASKSPEKFMEILSAYYAELVKTRKTPFLHPDFYLQKDKMPDVMSGIRSWINKVERLPADPKKFLEDWLAREYKKNSEAIGDVYADCVQY